jgi:hypothetical protein
MSKLEELQTDYKILTSNVNALEHLCRAQTNICTTLFRGHGSDLHEVLADEARELIAQLLEAAQASKATYKKKLDAIEELLGE